MSHECECTADNCTGLHIYLSITSLSMVSICLLHNDNTHNIVNYLGKIISTQKVVSKEEGGLVCWKSKWPLEIYLIKRTKCIYIYIGKSNLWPIQSEVSIGTRRIFSISPYGRRTKRRRQPAATWPKKNYMYRIRTTGTF